MEGFLNKGSAPILPGCGGIVGSSFAARAKPPDGPRASGGRAPANGIGARKTPRIKVIQLLIVLQAQK